MSRWQVGFGIGGGGRIVSTPPRSFLQQRFDPRDRGRFAHIISAPLERQPKHSQFFSSQRPQRTSYFFHKASTLIRVDLHHFLEQSEVVSALRCYGVKCLYILGKAGTAITDAGVQKLRPDPAI